VALEFQVKLQFRKLLIFEEGGKPEEPGEKPSLQRLKSTANSTHQ